MKYMQKGTQKFSVTLWLNVILLSILIVLHNLKHNDIYAYYLGALEDSFYRDDG